MILFHRAKLGVHILTAMQCGSHNVFDSEMSCLGRLRGLPRGGYGPRREGTNVGTRDRQRLKCGKVIHSDGSQEVTVFTSATLQHTDLSLIEDHWVIMQQLTLPIRYPLTMARKHCGMATLCSFIPPATELLGTTRYWPAKQGEERVKNKTRESSNQKCK